MTVSLTHSKIIVNKPATANTNDVDAVDWNEEHVLTLASGNLLGVTLTAGATQCGIINYDNTYPGADGYVLHITGSYEAA